MKKRKTLSGLTLVKILLYTFFGLFLLLPLFSVFLVSFTGQPMNILGALTNSTILSSTIEKLKGFSLEHYKVIFTNKGYYDALLNSLWLALLVSVIVIIVCIPIAYGIARTKMPLKKTISALCTIPLIVPTFISAYAFIIMFGRSGWVTYIYQMLGGEGLLINPYSMTGIIMVQVFFFFPYALWPMVAAFKVSDLSLEEASRNLGAKNWLTFITVTFPLAIPGILSTVLIIFAVSFSDFGSPIILAPKDLNLLVVEAYREIAGFFNWAGAAILTVVMILVATFFFWLQNLFTKNRNYGSVSGKPKLQKLNDNKVLTRVLSAYSAVIVFVPVFAMLSIFVQSIATTWGKDPLPNGYTLKHYQTIFTSSLGNIQNSIVLAIGALLLSVIIATFISYFVVRQNNAKLDFMTSIPLVVPGIALGIALIQTFNTAPLQLTGTALILIIGYTIRRLPYMIRSTMGTMRAIKQDIEEAAINLGASQLTAALTVIGPLMLPGIAAGSILVFVTVIKETSISILLAPAEWAPMSLAIFQNILRGEYYSAAAMSVILVVLVLILQAIANKLTKKQQR
ncbi:iron ABC transporter permease [Heyndrickxia sporothermodurans]|uniref:ABC transporter permease n=1 Tax=Heyndrickxia sporothermodurans TaxID=46224 RepID=UPI002E220465|nr:iron ABC transporter permease [Heyndrickxia sporothermodurans]MED3653571.1 iron ABC transporter permease [Heyndrickxia sporothermodurans]MED3699525.1 iron ABC transporter permease [Heyndrickxia sporothermodurans]MED3782572.1 iron ABC transporter permease [Heyndrickxia sporothermodurans]